MNQAKSSRREFVRKSLALTAGLTVAQASPMLFGANSTPKPRTLRLGAPSYVKTEDPEELAMTQRKLGYRAAYCPKNLSSKSDKLVAIREAFAKHDLVIAEVGRWCNLMEADPEKRKANLDNVIDGLAVADAVGALCCVDIAGSFSSSAWYGPHPDNLSQKHFDASVENARKIIDAVKPKHAKFCYEMMGWATPDSAESYLKLIKAVDRPAFAVHLDPCNLINSPTRFYNNSALLNETFEKLGRWIVSCHAKDLTWDLEMNVHFREVVPGKGSLDYATLLRRMAQLPHNPPLMMEHLTSAEEYAAGRDYIFKVGTDIGVSFE